MSLQPRRRSWLSQWPTMVWLAIAWTLMWGEFSWANGIGGLLIAAAVTFVLPLPAMGLAVHVRPWQMVRLVVYFMSDLIKSSFQVAFQALDLRFEPHGAVVGVRLRNPADLYLTVTAELSTLIPGSIVVEAHRLTGMLYLHVLDLAKSGGEDAVRANVLELERRVLYALATDEELRNSGLPVTRLRAFVKPEAT